MTPRRALICAAFERQATTAGGIFDPRDPVEHPRQSNLVKLGRLLVAAAGDPERDLHISARQLRLRGLANQRLKPFDPVGQPKPQLQPLAVDATQLPAPAEPVEFAAAGGKAGHRLPHSCRSMLRPGCPRGNCGVSSAYPLSPGMASRAFRAKALTFQSELGQNSASFEIS
jgi:hypothetical protein